MERDVYAGTEMWRRRPDFVGRWVKHDNGELMANMRHVELPPQRYECPECGDEGTVTGSRAARLVSGGLKCSVCAGDNGRDVAVRRVLPGFEHKPVSAAPCPCHEHLVAPRNKACGWHRGRCQRVISDDEIGRALRAWLKGRR